MLTWVLLTLAITTAPPPPSSQPPAPQPAADARTQAEQLARSGSYRAALERFQALAAANPDDVEARIWIARLHALMDDDERAVTVYESIIATHPKHFDALVGLGDAFVRMGRLSEASDVLARAEAQGAEIPSLLAAQGRLHYALGHLERALGYYQRALAIDSASTTVREEYDQLRREHAHRLELGYLLEHFNQDDTPDPQAGFGTVNLRVNDALRVSGTVQYERKFSEGEVRGGGGVEWLLTPAFQLHAGVLVGDDGLILPKVDGYGGINYRVGRATWSFDLRFAEFDSVDVQIGGAGLKIALPHDASVSAKYYRFSTDYSEGLSDIVHSWVLGASGHPAPTWTVGAEYTRGPDQLDLLTIDQTGVFEANTYSGFVELLLSPMLSIQGRYDYQDRPAAVRVHRGTFRLVHRF
jgi:YaiO family outer membrane protein